MVQRSNLLTISRWAAIFLFVMGVVVCGPDPARVFADGSETPAAPLPGEEIATFDLDEEAIFDQDEEAIFDPAPTAEVSPLLHAPHHHSPSHFPERVKRSVSSHPWMHAAAFAVLVLLALATTRLFGKRKPEPIPMKKHSAVKKIAGISVWVVLAIYAAAGVSNALVYSPVKDAVVSFLGEDRKLYQTAINITPDTRQMLKAELDWEPRSNSIKVYYSKTPEGAVDAYAFVLTDRLQLCGGVHKFCIKVSSGGQIEGVKILELTCDRSYIINTRAFVNQFKAFNTENADHQKYNSISGATLSADLTRDVVRRALVLFNLLKG